MIKISDVDALPVKETMPLAAQRVRVEAPKFIASIINDTNALMTVDSIEQLREEHIQALSGGVDAATYLVNLPNERVIIKLSYAGLEAEAEAINAWRARHVRTPKVLRTGIVPSTKDTKQPVKFLMQQAMVTSEGRLIETCANYLVHSPKKARQIGTGLGQELAKIHSCVSTRLFGEFKDAAGSHSSYHTWNGYVVDAIKYNASYLEELGIEQSAVKSVIDFAKQHTFVSRGRYIHGDFSIRNVALKSYEPLKLSVFDPNPLIGDPSWDISFLINNYELQKRRRAYDDSQHDLYTMHQQLWIGFKQGYARKIHEKSLLVAQFIQAIYQAQYTQRQGDDIGLRVRTEFLQDTAKKIASFLK
jgi:fructosamine-3-kinase